MVGPRIYPAVDKIQVIRLETWLAINPQSFVEVSWTKNDVDYRAVPKATIWDFTDRTVRCDGPGVEYTPGAEGPAPCGREWEHTTSVGPMTMTVRVEYEVFWEYVEGDPPIKHSGSYTDHSKPGTWDLQVGEIQTNGVTGDAQTPQYGDGSGGGEQSADRVPGTAGDDNPIDSIDFGAFSNPTKLPCEAFKYAIENIPGIDVVFDLVDGCFENVSDFVGALWWIGEQAIAGFDDPVEFVKEKIEQFQALIDAIKTDPVAFAEEFPGDTSSSNCSRRTRPSGSVRSAARSPGGVHRWWPARCQGLEAPTTSRTGRSARSATGTTTPTTTGTTIR